MSADIKDRKGPRVIVALDYASAAEALAFAQRLDPKRCRVKVGKELFTVSGPALVEQLVALVEAVLPLLERQIEVVVAVEQLAQPLVRLVALEQLS